MPAVAACATASSAAICPAGNAVSGLIRYRKVVQGAWSPTYSGSSFQPCATTVVTHVELLKAALVHARRPPPMYTPMLEYGDDARHAAIDDTGGASHVSNA